MLLSLYCVMHFNDINGLYLLVLRWLLRSSITRRSSFLTHARLLVIYSFGITCKTKCHTFLFQREMTTLIPWFTALAFLQDCLLQLTLTSSLVHWSFTSFAIVDVQYSIDLLHDKVAEEEMSRNPLDLDPLPVDQPLCNHDSNDDRSKESSTHPTLSDDSKEKMTLTMTMTKTMMMSSSSIHSLMLMYLGLQIVHSLFFTYPLRTLLATIHHMTLNKTTLYQIPLQLGRARLHVSVTVDEVLRSYWWCS